MNFLRLRLTTRIYSGYSVLVLLGLALAGFAVWELSTVKTGVQTLAALNDNTARALAVANEIQIIRRANLRYTVDADEQATREATAAELSAIGLLKEADATLS